MHNLGKAQRCLFVVRGEGEIPDLPLTLTNCELKRVGELRTAYLDGETWQGVAILKTRFANVGEILVIKTNEVSYTSSQGRISKMTDLSSKEVAKITCIFMNLGAPEKQATVMASQLIKRASKLLRSETFPKRSRRPRAY